MATRTVQNEAWFVVAAATFTDTTTWHYGPTATDASVIGPLVFLALNGLNQGVSLKYQGSIDGTNWVDLGTTPPFSVAAGASRPDTLTDNWPLVRPAVQAQVVPSTGQVTFQFSWTEET